MTKPLDTANVDGWSRIGREIGQCIDNLWLYMLSHDLSRSKEGGIFRSLIVT